jgi:putative sterol carrier protein
MAVFPSEEWLKALVDTLNASAEYEKAASTWEGDIAFAVLAEEGMLDRDIYLYANPYHGKISDPKVLDSLEGKDITFVITGPYSVWKEIIQGKTDSMQAIMRGKLKVKGNMQA